MNDFEQTIINIHKDKGAEWLEKLPLIIELSKKRWNLKLIIPFDNLSCNFVAKALNDMNQSFVVKIGIPVKELITEIEILRSAKNYEYVKLIDYDTSLGIMLLEHLKSGESLAKVDNELATEIASEVMRKIWMPIPEQHNLPTVSDWYKEFIVNSEKYSSNSIFPFDLLKKANKMFHQLNNSVEEKFVLHGDLHHDNILSNGNHWTAIDPKGVIGEPVFEISTFLRNNLMKNSNPEKILQRRIEIFNEKLGISKQRMYDWGFVQTISFALWSYENNFSEWRETIECAKLFL